LPAAALYVLDGLPPGSAPLFAELNLRPTLGSLEELAEWTGFCRTAGIRPAALHVDTGMNRLGLRVEQALVLEPAALADAGIDLVLTHLASGETPADRMNAQQRTAFAGVVARFPGIRASLAASAGIFHDAAAHYDLVRPGFALYGGNPTPGADNPMLPVVRLDAPILQLRSVEPGETVGYNGRWHAQTRRTIAVIGVGYADGFLRSGSGEDGKPGGFGIVAGQKCPFVGRISMDLITLDVTEAPGVSRGDPVQLIGPDNPIDQVAAELGTSGYEVLTGLGRRFSRRYLGGSANAASISRS
jgi:alanine racemase